MDYRIDPDDFSDLSESILLEFCKRGMDVSDESIVLTLMFGMVLIAGVVFFLFRRYVSTMLNNLVAESETDWDDIILNKWVIAAVPILPVSLCIYLSADVVFSPISEWYIITHDVAMLMFCLSSLYMGLAIVWGMHNPRECVSPNADISIFLEETKTGRVWAERIIIFLAITTTVFYSVYLFFKHYNEIIDMGMPGCRSYSMRTLFRGLFFMNVTTVVGLGVYYLLQLLIFGHVMEYVRYSKTIWDDVSLNNKTRKRLSAFLAIFSSYLVVRYYFGSLLPDHRTLYILFNFVLTIVALMILQAVTHGVRYPENYILEDQKDQLPDGHIKAVISLIAGMINIVAIFSAASYLISVLAEALEFGEDIKIVSWIDTLLRIVRITTASMLGFFVCRSFAIGILMKIVSATETKWDDVILNPRTLNFVSLLVPGIVASFMLDFEFGENVPSFARLIIGIYSTVIAVLVCFGISYGLKHAGEFDPELGKKPLHVFAQTLQIISLLIGGIIIVSILMNEAPAKLLAGLGASAALLTFVFKDSLVGLLAGIQMTFNKMVSIGDWITVPGINANGYVREITLNTVKIENFDKSIITVPPSTLLSGSFQNWRNMQNSGTRRIMRTLNLDFKTIRLCTEQDLERISKLYDVLENEVRQRQPEYVVDRQKLMSDGTGQSNLHLLRLYLSEYIRTNKYVDSEGSMYMIRQMQPKEVGLPLEIYAFVWEVRWAPFEWIQSEIFDHIISVIPEFGINIYQRDGHLDSVRV